MFPDPDMPGVDLVLPDFTYLRERADRIDGIVVTHSHEDHTGALPFLLREIEAPIYGSALALAMASGRIREAGLLDRQQMRPVADGEKRRIGPIDVQFIPVTHSVPHAMAAAYFTPAGTIIHTGDFKLDVDPVDGRRTDLALLGEIAKRDGVRLLLADSTNAERPGYTPSESTIGVAMRGLFREHADKRVVVASFASHLHRIQQVAEAAIANNRRVAFLGRSMIQNVALAREMHMFDIPTREIIEPQDIEALPPSQVCVICTGSQGEPLSALALMAAHEHKQVSIGPNDLVVISAHAIPGNESNVNRTVDGLMRSGAEVVHDRIAPVHVSGHASQEELKSLIGSLQPEWFVPVHGEYHHMVANARLAQEVGVVPDHTLVCEDGDVLELTSAGVKVRRRAVPAGYVYVDGSIDGVDNAILRDRQALSEEGVVVVIVTVDSRTGEVVTGPEIVTHGWVHADEAEGLLEIARERVKDSIQSSSGEPNTDFETLRRHIRRSLSKFIYAETKLRPVVIPVVMEV